MSVKLNKKSDHFYFCKQHGANIVLLMGWLIAVSLSKQFYLIQIINFLFLFSILNFGELLLLFFKQKNNSFRLKYLFIYFLILVSCSSILLFESPLFLISLPYLALLGLLLLVLQLNFHNKSILVQFLSFSFLSFLSLLTLNPYENNWSHLHYELWLVESIYFTLSVFLINYKMKRIKIINLFYFFVFCNLLLLTLLGLSWKCWAFLILIDVKLIPIFLNNGWFIKLKFKQIGIMETLSSIVLFLILVL